MEEIIISRKPVIVVAITARIIDKSSNNLS